jgi:hypothetical protein
MKFFNLDLHIAVIADVKEIFKKLGHQVTSWDISGHSWVFDRERTSVDVVNECTWENLDREMCDKFFERYKDELASYDAFITTHTPSFSMLYEKFEKPIISIASTRYEFPFSNKMILWSKFNKYLQENIDNGRLIAVSNNKYDVEYCKLFTNRDWEHIPSLCEYTKSKYRGIKNEFLYSSKFKPRINIKSPIIDKDIALGRGYKWQNIADYKGVVHIPYNASVMSITEQYTACIPLFIPSWEFLKELREKYYNAGVLSELSWNQVRNHQGGYFSNSTIPVNTIKDPNNYLNNDIMMEWVKLSDFYDEDRMPHIQYFNSFEHLDELLASVNLENISKQMAIQNTLRKKETYEKWNHILEKLV